MPISLRTLLLVLFLLKWTRKSLLQLKGRGFAGTALELYHYVRRRAYGLFLQAPGVRSQIDKQVKDASQKLQDKLVSIGPGVNRYSKLPLAGWSNDQVRKELASLSEMKHTRWEDGRVSGAVYHGGEDLAALQTEAFGKFTVANPIHPDVFPGVRKMEAEVVAMVCCNVETHKVEC